MGGGGEGLFLNFQLNIFSTSEIKSITNQLIQEINKSLSNFGNQKYKKLTDINIILHIIQQ